MQWLNEPVSWQRTADMITVSVDPGTDFWRETGYGYIRDSGHIYGEVLAGDLDLSVRVRGTFSAQYDQAGLMLRVDDRVWLKTGMEFFEGRARLSTVLTLGQSSWMVTDLPEGTDEITLRASRRGDAVEIRYQLADGPPELAALVFMPPGREVLAGIMCAAPEGPGFGVTFHDLYISGEQWEGGAGPAAATWAGEDAAAWLDQPGGVGVAGWERDTGGPGTGWAAGAAADPHADWPGEPAETAAPAWPDDADPGGAAPGWAAGTSGSAEPGWAAGEPDSAEPGWAGGTSGSAEPGWAAGEPDSAEPGWAAAAVARDDAAAGWPEDEADGAAPAGPEAAGEQDAGPALPPSPGGDAEPAGTRAEAGEADAGDAAGEDTADDDPASGAGPPPEAPAKDAAGWSASADTDPRAGWALATAPATVATRPESLRASEAGEISTSSAAGEGEDKAEAGAAADTGPGTATPPRGDAPEADGARGSAGENDPRGAAVDEAGDSAGDGKEVRWLGAPVAGEGPATREPAVTDPAADWDRLAAGSRAAAWRPVRHADVLDEGWPGPPLAARQITANGAGTGARNGTGPLPIAPAAPDQAAGPPLPAAAGRPAASAEDPDPGMPEPGRETSADAADGREAEPEPEPAGETVPEPAAAGRSGPFPVLSRWTRAKSVPADLTAPPDPADEWISLLTADPADE